MEKEQGREICDQLRSLRKEFAAANDIAYEFKECTHEGPCSGTCEFCEQEAAELERLAGKKQFEEFRQVVYPWKEVTPVKPVQQDFRDMPCIRTPGLIRAPKGMDVTPAPSKQKSSEIKIPEFLQTNKKKP